MDPRKLLEVPLLYRLFRQFIGRDDMRQWYAQTYIRAQTGHRVLDIGCGTGDILNFLPDVEYIGFDMDSAYIEAARLRFGSRGTFFCEPVGEGVNFQPASFDIVIAHGVLHHLNDDEATALFKIAHASLKSGGRLISIDPCYAEGQSMLSRFLVSRDRGAYVRSKSAYIHLATSEFAHVDTTVRHDLIRIPYTHLIMECTA